MCISYSYVRYGSISFKTDMKNAKSRNHKSHIPLRPAKLIFIGNSRTAKTGHKSNERAGLWLVAWSARRRHTRRPSQKFIAIRVRELIIGFFYFLQIKKMEYKKEFFSTTDISLYLIFLYLYFFPSWIFIILRLLAFII